MSVLRCDGRRILGAVLVLAGVLLVFVCMPLQVFVIALGIMLAAAGLYLLG